MSDTLHVVPDDQWEDFPHEPIPTCWCQPVLDYEAPMSGRLYVHRRYLDGPVYELLDPAMRINSCICGGWVADPSGDSGCGNCGADEPPEGQFDAV